jgi:hypothetical protein
MSKKKKTVGLLDVISDPIGHGPLVTEKEMYSIEYIQLLTPKITPMIKWAIFKYSVDNVHESLHLMPWDSVYNVISLGHQFSNMFNIAGIWTYLGSIWRDKERDKECADPCDLPLETEEYWALKFLVKHNEKECCQ